ncbi:MAG: helix-turn-helix domain-containing protein [Pseudomonadota bacterium]
MSRQVNAITRTGRRAVELRFILRNSLEKLVASAFQLDETLLRMPTRGRARVARARQVAMYLAHTACGRSLTEVGQMFERDRTTVAHACVVIEEAREDAEFDRAVDLLELSSSIILTQAILPMVLEDQESF